MNMRGAFEGLFDRLDVDWTWKVRLLDVDLVSLPVLMRSREELAPIRKAFLQHLRKRRQEYDQFSNRAFVYFIGRRPKVRFASRRPAKLRDDQIELRVFVGKSRWPQTVRCPVPLRARSGAPCQTQVGEGVLTFVYPDGGTLTSTLFDYLDACDIDIGLHTTIDYIGKTQSPEHRPTNLEHRGLTETASCKGPNEDIVILYHAFHARTYARHPCLSIVASNSLTNQLHADSEALYIESVLIDYFRPQQQEFRSEREQQALRGFEDQLKSIGVRKVELEYEVDAKSDNYRLSSQSVPPARAHRTTRNLADSSPTGS